MPTAVYRDRRAATIENNELRTRSSWRSIRRRASRSGTFGKRADFPWMGIWEENRRAVLLSVDATPERLDWPR
jgi:hypothetical protein